MTTDARRRAERFMYYGNQIPRRPCPVCGLRFFTGVGVEEHVRLNHPTHQMEPLPCGGSAREHGLRLAARNNAHRRRCSVCGLESTPAALGMHQKASGHIGWAEA